MVLESPIPSHKRRPRRTKHPFESPSVLVWASHSPPFPFPLSPFPHFSANCGFLLFPYVGLLSLWATLPIPIPQHSWLPESPHAMMPLQSIEAPAPSSTADENGEHRQQKPKTLPCKYCSKRFRSATPEPRPPPLLHISLHCSLILGVWSMSRGTRELTPRKSPSRAAGFDAGRRLEDGELLVLNPPTACPRSFLICVPQPAPHSPPPLLFTTAPSPSSFSCVCVCVCVLVPTPAISFPIFQARPNEPLCLVSDPANLADSTIWPHQPRCPMLEEVCLYGHQ